MELTPTLPELGHQYGVYSDLGPFLPTPPHQHCYWLEEGHCTFTGPVLRMVQARYDTSVKFPSSAPMSCTNYTRFSSPHDGEEDEERRFIPLDHVFERHDGDSHDDGDISGPIR